MKTEDLIRAIAADSESRDPGVPRRLAFALLPALVVSILIFFLAIGPRPDIAAAVGEPRFLFKFVVTLTLAFTALFLAFEVARPDADMSWRKLALFAAPGLLALAVLIELNSTLPGERMSRLIGNNWRYCLAYIPLLAAPFLIAALVAFRHGAPARPGLAGAIAGLIAGALGATLYAAHCTDDSPLFVATWYSLAIAVVTLAGAVAGTRWLRW